MTIIYAACVAGAIGVLLLLPRRGNRMGPAGAILAGGALGAALIALTRYADRIGPELGGDRPGIFFYILAFLAAGGAVRMISHPRPIYAALYFILVVLATAGLFLLLSAEFMAFALVIVYAGAILVTYLFVIMLAQEASEEGDLGALAAYDTNAREPVGAVIASFVLLAALLGVMYRSTANPRFAGSARNIADETPASWQLTLLGRKVEAELEARDLIRENERVDAVDVEHRRAIVAAEGTAAMREVALPDDLVVENVEAVGVSLMGEFPVSLEVAGIILMMAMLGAVVLARKPEAVRQAGAAEHFEVAEPLAPSAAPRREAQA